MLSSGGFGFDIRYEDSRNHEANINHRTARQISKAGLADGAFCAQPPAADLSQQSAHPRQRRARKRPGQLGGRPAPGQAAPLPRPRLVKAGPSRAFPRRIQGAKPVAAWGNAGGVG